MAEALAELAETVDLVSWAAPAKPLAPLKFGGASNNVNLQIAAVWSGLAMATRPHALRVRADLTLTGPLLEHYAECVASSPPAAMLEQRVMICHLFTPNPYTVERLPMHFSDWYQLGATRDLRSMWAIEPFTDADASYCQIRARPRSSVLEVAVHRARGVATFRRIFLAA